MSRFKELQEELKLVFSGQQGTLLDSLVPLVLFFLINPFWGLIPASWISIGSGLVFFILRLIQKRKLRYALLGVGGAILAAGFVYLSGTEAGFAIPGLISGGITVLLCLASVLFRRPLAAWTSYLTRRWPIDWYWHNRIRPAYTQVTLIWAVAFAARLALEYWLSIRQSITALGVVKVLLGWPYTIIILIISYLYGIWRLGTLAGPSVAEYQAGTEPPWSGQKRGF